METAAAQNSALVSFNIDIIFYCCKGIQPLRAFSGHPFLRQLRSVSNLKMAQPTAFRELAFL